MNQRSLFNVCSLKLSEAGETYSLHSFFLIHVSTALNVFCFALSRSQLFIYQAIVEKKSSGISSPNTFTWLTKFIASFFASGSLTLNHMYLSAASSIETHHRYRFCISFANCSFSASEFISATGIKLAILL
jgi:hypothetical protein